MVTRSIPLISSLKREAISTDTFTAKTEKLNPGDVLELCGIGSRNANSANKVVDIGVIRGNKAFYMQSVTLTTAGLWYFRRFHIKIPSEYQIVLRIVTPTAGDAFTFSIFGFLEPCIAEYWNNGE